MSTPTEVVLRARRVVTPEGERSAVVVVSGTSGRITAVRPYDADTGAAQVTDLRDDEVLLPGLVDTHVHVNEPGRTEWEGFVTATRAATAGGVTTMLDMPLNSIPPTVDVAALELKRACASDSVYCDVGFWGGAVPGNLGRLRPLHKAGVFGFKCFLLDSGVEEFPPLDPAGLGATLREVHAFGGLLIVHAEDAETIERASSCPRTSRYRDFLRSRPRDAENIAVARLIELARAVPGVRVHVLHLSSADALPLLAAARAEGLSITVETCPHYLVLTAEEVPDGATQYKCCPPIREAVNRDLLWSGLADGTIDAVVSDHSPCTPELKRFDVGDFGVAWGGISSLQLGVSAVWTESRRRGHGLTDLARWMAQRPAEVAGLTRKGRIAVGCDADFAVFAPRESYVVDPHALHHRNPVTPYSGRTLTGRVRATWLRGRRVGKVPHGRLLRRGEA